MAKYKIIPSSRTIVRSPISIGHKAEKGVKAIEFDLTAWVGTYGSGTLTVIMRRWGDEIPYPIALEIDENNKATWTLSSTDTAKAGMAYAQLNYIVGDEVVKKSDIYTFRVMDSLTGEGEPPEAYESWLEHLTHIAAEAMAEVLDIEGIVTDKTLTVDGGIADGKATGDALALKADKATTYTKTEVDTLIESVDVETDTTLSVSGKPADAKKVGDELGAINESLGDVQTDLYNIDNYGLKSNNLFPYKNDVRTFDGLTKIERIRNYYIFDGAQSTGNLLRFAIFNDSAVVSSIAPTYENRPAWYSPITSFIVGHRYWFGVKLVSGSYEWTGTSALDNFFDVRVQASGEVLYQSKNSSWVCNKIPEMICFSLGKGTYNNAVFELSIIDVTFVDEYMPERHAILDSSANKLKLFFVTDIHANLGAIQRLSHYISAHSDQIDEVINGGDTAIYEFASTANSNYFDSDLAPKALAVIGNHDSAVYGENSTIDWWGKTRKEVYDQYLAPYISGWNVVQPENAATLGLNYYYKDYGLIRIIYLDGMFWDTDQLTWFTNVLASAKAGAMDVICVAHGQDGGLTGDTNCNWTWYESPSQTGYYSNMRFDGGAASAINDFITGGGSFICWITGHTHRDKIGHLTDYPNQFVLNMNRSGGKPTETRAAYYSGTLIVVDRVNKVIKLVRCGDNFDAYLRPKYTLCYNYETQTLISQS